MKLYDYFRSSAAYRVRIALNVKGLAYESSEVHLVRNGGEHLSERYRAINPQARVPSLVTDTEAVLTQSVAILEWLEEAYPEPPLLPKDPVARAHVRAIVGIIACDIHPVNNLCTLNYLRDRLGQEQAAVDAWYAHWITEGFRAVEALIEGEPFCFGKSPTMADAVLVPQVFNARRFKVPLEAFPKILRADEAAMALAPFADARPEAVSGQP
jgi:maleylacetoacetate isomerase